MIVHELLVKAMEDPRGCLEVWDVLGVPAPALKDLAQLEGRARHDSTVVYCELHGWLERRIIPARESPLFWRITDEGRRALARTL